MKRLVVWMSSVLAVWLLSCTSGFAAAMPEFFVLNTEGGPSFRGNIDRIDPTGSTRTNILDVEPFPFTNIGDWIGFATDGEHYYFLNTDGGGAFPGRIDRVNLDGTGRTTVADVAPSEFNSINDWRGFATDGDFFYFLNTDGGGDFLGQIDRVNFDGTGRTTVADVSPTPFSNILDWEGFATDGEFFYFLNTGGGGAFPGRIDRLAMDGTGRMETLDVAPSLFNSIGDWRGFAAASVAPIPEPSGCLVFCLTVCTVLTRSRRHR